MKLFETGYTPYLALGVCIMFWFIMSTRQNQYDCFPQLSAWVKYEAEAADLRDPRRRDFYALEYAKFHLACTGPGVPPEIVSTVKLPPEIVEAARAPAVIVKARSELDLGSKPKT